MNRSTRLIKKLDVLKPHYLKITDESYMHASHRINCNETHFKVEIASEALDGKKIVQQHQIIYKLLEDEFNTGLHALSIRVIHVDDFSMTRKQILK